MGGVDHNALANELLDGIEDVSALLKALANEKRVAILRHLLQGEKSVGEMGQLLDLSQSALSQHLARLRGALIVKTRRVAQTIYYSLDGGRAKIVLRALHEASIEKPRQPDEITPRQSPAA